MPLSPLTADRNLEQGTVLLLLLLLLLASCIKE